MDTPDTTLGKKWMLPYHTTIAVDGGTGDITLTDADVTERFFDKDPGIVSPPYSYTAAKERDVMTNDATYATLTRFNGDKWKYSLSTKKLLSITSRTEHEITIAYDGSGKIDTITDGFGRVTQFLYVAFDGKIRISEIREPAPREVGWTSTLLEYGEDGRLIAVTNALGETTRFAYDGSSRVSQAIDGQATSPSTHSTQQPRDEHRRPGRQRHRN